MTAARAGLGILFAVRRCPIVLTGARRCASEGLSATDLQRGRRQLLASDMHLQQTIITMNLNDFT